MAYQNNKINAMKYAIVTPGTKNSMRLQSIGLVLGTPAGELKVGDNLMWNFGQVSVVKEITKETAKTIEIITVSRDSGYIGSRRFNKSRLVCKLENN